MKNEKMLAFMVDEAFHTEVRIRAAKEGMSLKRLLMEGLDIVLNKYSERENAARQAGTGGGHRAAQAIRNLMPEEKAQMNREAEEFDESKIML